MTQRVDIILSFLFERPALQLHKCTLQWRPGSNKHVKETLLESWEPLRCLPLKHVNHEKRLGPAYNLTKRSRILCLHGGFEQG